RIAAPPTARSLSPGAHSRDPLASPDDLSPQERGEVEQAASAAVPHRFITPYGLRIALAAPACPGRHEVQGLRWIYDRTTVRSPSRRSIEPVNFSAGMSIFNLCESHVIAGSIA